MLLVRSFLVLVSFIFLTACAGSSHYMQELNSPAEQPQINEEKAMVVFMRPSGLGFAVQSTVYDVTDGKPEFIAVISAKKKFAHYSPVGERRFMVIGESADFMSADLRAGRVYFALVTPRMGLWKARFSLKPVTAEAAGGEEFSNWYNDTQWVRLLPSASQWAEENSASIQSKYGEYLPDWMAKNNRPHLRSEDGLMQLP